MDKRDGTEDTEPSEGIHVREDMGASAWSTGVQHKHYSPVCKGHPSPEEGMINILYICYIVVLLI